MTRLVRIYVCVYFLGALAEKYESQSYRFWNNFYVRNETRFFKDRYNLQGIFCFWG